MNNGLIKTNEYHKFNNIKELNGISPPFQRLLIDEHINNIKNDYISSIKKNREPLVGFILLCQYNTQDNNFNFNQVYNIIDGQHRLEALKLLFDKGISIEIHTLIYTCENEKEAHELYIRENKTGMAHTDSELKNISPTNIENDIKKYLSLKENSTNWSINNCYRPKICIIIFLNKYKESKYFGKHTNIEQFKEFIYTKNIQFFNKLNNIKLNGGNLVSIYNINEHMECKSYVNNFYLGLDSGLSWLND